VAGIGFRHGLANLLGNFDMARDNYIKGAGQHWYSLRMEATDNLTLERIHCDCPIVGTWRSSLIVLQGGELRAVGESQEANNLYPIDVALIEGEPLRVVAHRVDMRGRSLRWLLDQIGTGRTAYLSGELRMGSRLNPPVQDLDQYRPARFAGQILKLHYARSSDLGPFLGMVAAEGELFLQFWLKPGDPPLELAIGVSDKADPIPAALKSYL
jgi:inner membrane protein